MVVLRCQKAQTNFWPATTFSFRAPRILQFSDWILYCYVNELDGMLRFRVTCAGYDRNQSGNATLNKMLCAFWNGELRFQVSFADRFESCMHWAKLSEKSVQKHTASSHWRTWGKRWGRLLFKKGIVSTFIVTVRTDLRYEIDTGDGFHGIILQFHEMQHEGDGNHLWGSIYDVEDCFDFHGVVI